eukprot:s975_g16.t1
MGTTWGIGRVVEDDGRDDAMIGDESVGSFEVVSDDVPPRDGHATSSMLPPSSGSNRRPSGGPALRSLRLMGEMEKETGKITEEDEGEKRAEEGSASTQEVKIQEDEEPAAASSASAATPVPEGGRPEGELPVSEGVLPEGELPVPEGLLPEGVLPEGEGLDMPVVKKEKKYRRVRKRKVKTEDPGEEALPPSSPAVATKGTFHNGNTHGSCTQGGTYIHDGFYGNLLNGSNFGILVFNSGYICDGTTNYLCTSIFYDGDCGSHKR